MMIRKREIIDFNNIHGNKHNNQMKDQKRENRGWSKYEYKIGEIIPTVKRIDKRTCKFLGYVLSVNNGKT